MLQIELLDPNTIISHQNVVNVASVPQRSPFRYAGGKTWLIPKIQQWLHYQGCEEDRINNWERSNVDINLTARILK
jgi:hypothetical protein